MPPGPVASMRPRTLIRGNERRPGPTRPSCGASMRPRTLIRGNLAMLHLALGLQQASMRPRTLIRGNSNPKYAEMYEARVASMRPRTLIRGNPTRGGSASPWRTGFNEAADSHPRKRGPGERPGPYPAASMRPRTLIRGNGPPGSPCRTDVYKPIREHPPWRA